MSEAKPHDKQIATERAGKLVRSSPEPIKFFQTLREYIDTLSPQEMGLVLQAVAVMAYAALEMVAEVEVKSGHYVTVDDILGVLTTLEYEEGGENN